PLQGGELGEPGRRSCGPAGLRRRRSSSPQTRSDQARPKTPSPSPLKDRPRLSQQSTYRSSNTLANAGRAKPNLSDVDDATSHDPPSGGGEGGRAGGAGGGGRARQPEWDPRVLCGARRAAIQASG